MKRGGGSKKGSSFERDICKELSLWWTYGDRDDVFWRTAGSGGRATNRMKQGMKTSGAYGDLTHVDHIGSPLLQLICFELKRGYGRWCILDVIDRRAGSKPSIAEAFWAQAKRSCADAKARYPMVIFKRDQKQIVVMSSKSLLTALAAHLGPHRGRKILVTIGSDPVFLMPLADFLEYADPEAMRRLV